MKKHRISCCILSTLFFIFNPLTIYAETLEDIQTQISNLSQAQMTIQEEIASLDSELLETIIQIQNIEEAIIENESNITDTQDQITKLSNQIEETQIELEKAQEQKEVQYEAMKIRLQYIYENGGEKWYISMLLQADNFSLFLNKIEFCQNIYDYDRTQLELYIETINQIEVLETNLEDQKAELQEKESSLMMEQTSLDGQKNDLIIQQGQLENFIAEKQKTNEEYEQEIILAQAKAEEINQLIKEQENLIKERDAAIAAQEPSEVVETFYEETTKVESVQNTQGSSSSGYDIVTYAEQFVGNPYVWGGNSLTNGIDCSHFVWQVLTNTGYYSGDYYTSGGWASLGNPVSSLSEAKAGDVIVYSGHVAIYDGAGGIIEAKGSAWGITHDRSADCKTIVAIRRFT